MQQKNLLILSVVTVVALAVAALSLRDSGTTGAAGEERLLFPELSEHINDVAEVRIEKAGKTTTLKKGDGGWQLADRGGYPAKFEKVKELAVRVADLEIEEEKTAKKANHEKLGVQWPAEHAEHAEGEGEGDGGEHADAGLVTLKDAGGKELAALVVGRSEWMGSKPKVYARRANEDQVYLCAPRGSFDVIADAKNWIEPKFVEVANDRIQNVTVEHHDGERIEIARSVENHTQFAVTNLPPGETERYAGVANGVAQALGYGLTLDDVRPVGEIDFTKEPLAKTRFRCVDGLELLLETCKFEDQTWAKVVASYTPPPEPAKAAEDAAGGTDEAADDDAAPGGEETPAAEPDAPEEEKKDVAKEAAELNERLAPWAFQIPSYKADVLVRRMKDLVQEPEPPADDGGLEGALQQLGAPLEFEAPAAEEPPAGDGGAEDAAPVEPEPAPDDEGGPPADAPNETKPGETKPDDIEPVEPDHTEPK
jgi:hypothetical protein